MAESWLNLIDSFTEIARDKHHSKIERVSAWSFQQRRLKVRCGKQTDTHQAFLTIGCMMFGLNRLTRFCWIP
ncbi:MAG: hypothetical protein FJ261_10055 [Planctomycetes bacterium]|nr:hypothetical protein [Planctomycetota bacterium]